MDVSDSRKKERSPVFPFIPLARAIERAAEFYKEEKRGTAPFTRAVIPWKYSPTSSGGLQTVAALKSYGLMEDVRVSGKERQIKLTDLALRILLDARPDSQERDEYLREAALNPTVSREIWERWPDGLPSDSTLNHYLVLERKFNEATAVGVVKILKQNQELTKSLGTELQSHSEDLQSESTMTSMQAVASPGRGELQPTAVDSSPAARAPQTAAGGVHLALRRNGVSISIHFSEEPTKETFAYLERYFTFEKDGFEAMPATPKLVNSAGDDQGDGTETH
jgi:hypothetical protein